jgi:hypothetical protein
MMLSLLQKQKEGAALNLTVQVKLMPTMEQESIIKETLKNYIHRVNGLEAEFVMLDKLEQKTCAVIKCAILRALKAQSTHDECSVFQRCRKELFKARKTGSPEGKTTPLSHCG